MKDCEFCEWIINPIRDAFESRLGRVGLSRKVFSLLALLLFLEMTVFSAFALDVAKEESHWYLADGTSERQSVLRILKDYRTGLSTTEEMRLAGVIVEESGRYGIDPLLVLALIKTESTFYNWAKSNKGAVGLMQIKPSTAAPVARELNLAWEGERSLYNPYLNVKLGIHYFSYLKDRYRMDTGYALAAYNSGPTYLSSRLRNGEGAPIVYRRKVIANYKKLKERVRIENVLSEKYKEVRL